MKGFSYAFAVLSAASFAAGHMEMVYPPPLQSRHNEFTTDINYDIKSPMKSDGSNFPCGGALKVLNSPQGKPVDEWNAGEEYSFKIAGQAYHSGGSCQASLSYDNGTTYKVIKSYEGNCPLSGGETSYTFEVPSDARDGDCIFSWSWFNKVGKPRDVPELCRRHHQGRSGPQEAWHCRVHEPASRHVRRQRWQRPARLSREPTWNSPNPAQTLTEPRAPSFKDPLEKNARSRLLAVTSRLRHHPAPHPRLLLPVSSRLSHLPASLLLPVTSRLSHLPAPRLSRFLVVTSRLLLPPSPRLRPALAASSPTNKTSQLSLHPAITPRAASRSRQCPRLIHLATRPLLCRPLPSSLSLLLFPLPAATTTSAPQVPLPALLTTRVGESAMEYRAGCSQVLAPRELPASSTSQTTRLTAVKACSSSKDTLESLLRRRPLNKALYTIVGWGGGGAYLATVYTRSVVYLSSCSNDNLMYRESTFTIQQFHSTVGCSAF
ncbi:hypothetical protein J3459_006101 [Metarhizium acridum]|nr:hypothetical protein J3459_006101 [Metarhizium acridum]